MYVMKRRERETDVTIVDIGFLYSMDVCVNVSNIFDCCCHTTVTTRPPPDDGRPFLSFLFLFVVVEAPSYIRLRPS